MALRTQIIILCFMFLAFVYIVNLMRRKVLDYKFALGWLVVIVVISILTIWPPLLSGCSGMLGIASPVNMLFFFGFCLLVILIFSLSITISRLEDRVKKLSQEIAIMRKDEYDRHSGLKNKTE